MNPLLNTFDTPFETIPFSQIRNEHYLPAIQAAIEEVN
jgi:peptidyl-dipeptidase Dcp